MVALACVALLVYQSRSADDDVTVPTPAAPSATGAYVACMEQVRAVLKSPSTADFPWGPDQSTPDGRGAFTVLGHVDSHNAFGATIRTKWLCLIQGEGGGRWRLLRPIMTE